MDEEIDRCIDERMEGRMDGYIMEWMDRGM